MASWSSITIKVCTTKNKYDTRSTITWNSKVRSAVCHLYHYPCKHIYMKWFFSNLRYKRRRVCKSSNRIKIIFPFATSVTDEYADQKEKKKGSRSCNKLCQLEYLLQSYSSASSRRYISNSGKSCEISLPVTGGQIQKPTCSRRYIRNSGKSCEILVYDFVHSHMHICIGKCWELMELCPDVYCV